MIGPDSSYLKFTLPNYYTEDVYCIGALENPILHLNLGKYDTVKSTDTKLLRDSTRLIISLDSSKHYDTVSVIDSFWIDTTILVPIQKTRYQTISLEKGGIKIELIDSNRIEGAIEFHHENQVISGDFSIIKCQ